MEKYVEWVKQGLLPGPSESESDYNKRALYNLSLKEIISKELMPENALHLEELIEKEILQKPLAITAEELGVRPTFLPLFFSNRGLSFFHGGAAWIFQQSEDGPLGAFIQLRRSFYNHDRFLWIYSRDELIAHEMAHAARMAYTEPKYEEILAYRTSKSSITRFLGPLLSSSFESRFFLILLVTVVAMDLAALFFHSMEVYTSALWIKGFTLAFIGWLALKLYRKQKTVAVVEEKLKKLYPGKEKALLFCLTDKEIDNFAKEPLGWVQDYIEQEPTFRLEMVREWLYS